VIDRHAESGAKSDRLILVLGRFHQCVYASTCSSPLLRPVVWSARRQAAFRCQFRLHWA
jgi:hypothetical protein